MISELLRKAESSGLTGCDSRRVRPIHWFIDLDADGRLLGFSPTVRLVENTRGESVERRGKAFKVPANYHMQWKGEKIQSVCTNDSNWLPDFLCGPANEIFPAGVSGSRIYRFREVTNAIRTHGKRHPDRNRLQHLRLWRRLVFSAEKDKPRNPVIRAIANYIRSSHALRFADLPLSVEGEGRIRFLKSFEDGKEYLSFRVNGRVAVSDRELSNWWSQRTLEQRQVVVAHLGRGRDDYAPNEGPITEYFPSVFGGVPFASFNAASFVSYGLGSQTATFRLETAEMVAAALNSMLNDPNASLQLGDETAVFWAVPKESSQQIAADFMQLLDQPDPLAVQDYLRGIWGTRSPEIATADFHVAILLKGTGRFSVRSWHTDTLGHADQHVRRYFEAIALPEGEAQPPAMRVLAWATIAKTKKQKTKPAPVSYNAIFEAAWRGTPLPFDMLAATIERQRVELASSDPDTADFKARLAARTALIQLYFALKPNAPLSTTSELIMNAKETAILCGRLLALLDRIHDAAHDGKSASSPANRLYGAASATPALVFPWLCQLARYHLQKIGGGWAYNLEFGVPKEKRKDGVPQDFEGLAAIVARLKEAADGDFPRILSLEDQCRFALGFYYERERCRQWPSSQSDKPEPSNS